MKITTLSVAAAILILSACSESSSPTGPDTARLGVPFQLGVGEASSIRGEPVRIRFDRVADDSRCPSDAICIWQGEVMAVFQIEIEATTYSFSLSTLLMPRQGFDGYEVYFREAHPGPSPTSTGCIPPNHYRVDLVVTK